MGAFEKQIQITRCLYNSRFPTSEFEFHADKDTAVFWFKNLKAFDWVEKNKSYAEALSYNLNEGEMKCWKTLQFPNNTIASLAKNFIITTSIKP